MAAFVFSRHGISNVMAGLDPAMTFWESQRLEDVDPRHKAGDDE
ncbi:hypothetical protein [Microvirga sp. G4-2]